jgi:hypothetical protein
LICFKRSHNNIYRAFEPNKCPLRPRKQLTVIWNMLKYKEKYDKDKQPVLSIEQLKAKKKYLEKELNKLSFLEEKQ